MATPEQRVKKYLVCFICFQHDGLEPTVIDNSKTENGIVCPNDSSHKLFIEVTEVV